MHYVKQNTPKYNTDQVGELCSTPTFWSSNRKHELGNLNLFSFAGTNYTRGKTYINALTTKTRQIKTQEIQKTIYLSDSPYASVYPLNR